MSPDGPQPGGVPPDDDRSVGELVLDVSERVSILIREEIELAKSEIREKVTKLVQGSVVGLAAAVFALMGLALLMHGIAGLLNDHVFSDHVRIGFGVRVQHRRRPSRSLGIAGQRSALRSRHEVLGGQSVLPALFRLLRFLP